MQKSNVAPLPTLSVRIDLDTEGRIAYARQFYNDSVVTYNTKIQQFPTVILANTFNFERRELFDAAPEDTEPVQVQF